MKDNFINVSRFSKVINKIVVVIALLVLVGWQFNIVLFKSISPNLRAMNPISAVLFILSSMAVYFINEKHSDKTIKIGKYIGLLIAAIALIRLVGVNPSFDIGIDKIIYGKVVEGNRMAINAALNFFLIGLSLFIIDKRKDDNFLPSQLIALAAFIISLLAVIGYLYSYRNLNLYSALVPMAIHTAITFLLLTSAILLTRYRIGIVAVLMDKKLGGFIMRKLLPILILTPIIVNWLRLEGQRLNWYSLEIGSSLVVTVNISVFTALLWWIAKSLNKTDKKRNETELKLISVKDDLEVNEIKYRNLIENAGVVMYTTTLNGCITFASSKAFLLTGYNIKELAGLHFTELVDAEWLKRVVEKYNNQLKSNVEETVMEFCMRTKYGDQKWVEQSAVLIRENDVPVGFQCIVKDISEKKEMEDVLRKYEVELVQNKERLQSILDNTSSLIYIKDLEGKYLLINEQFKEALNVDENVIGKTDFDFADAKQAQLFKDTDEQVIQTGKPVELEEIIDMPGGKEHMLITKFPLLDSEKKVYGISGIATNITERKRIEQEMADGKKLLKTIIDILPLNVYMKDLQSRKTLINKSELNYSKAINEDEILGKNDFDLYPGKNAKISIQEDMEVFTTRKAILNKETTSVDKEGKETWFLTSKIPFINDEDKVMGLIGISYDITDRITKRQELMQAKKVAEEAKKMQEQFLANMSHEIRTPMNGIQGMTDLLLETNLNDEQKDFTKTIKRSSDNLLVIINDILDFSKIKAGKLTIEKIDFKLPEVLDNIKSIFKHRIKEKGLELLLTVHEDVPATLNGDPYRLNQILINLVGNAIKFTHSGCIKVNIAIQKKTSKAIVLNFTIKDTGIGIAENKLGEMFESFTQASIETSRKYGGTGLGLSITKQLIEMQAGEISVESKIDVGTTFIFSIPYNYCKNENELFFAGKDVNTYRTLLKGKKFLIAEDNLVNQKVIRHVLQKAGGIVDIVNNGLEAISLLKQENAYHLIIMDLQMPEMDGYAATKYIRNVMNLSTPIIAMTASALTGEKSKCIEIGMNDYLSKPFDFALLYKRISLLIGDAPVTSCNEVVEKQKEEKLFDLSLLEEMDDNEYLVDILSIFLNQTPLGLNELEKACTAGNFNDVFKMAHKLKSSTGLLKASGLLNILIKIEDTAKAEKNDGLVKLSQKANEAYKKIETPLQEHLKNVHATLGIAV